MDIRSMGVKATGLLKKYRYVVLILAVGIVLMCLPQRNSSDQTQTPTVTQPQFSDPTEELTQILSQIQGAGKVKVMLTVHGGEKILYQTDQDRATTESSGSVKVQTVIVTGSDRSQTGLIQQTIAPEYRGAIIVCQGADNDAVRLAVVEAVADATGLGTDRISVLKMK